MSNFKIFSSLFKLGNEQRVVGNMWETYCKKKQTNPHKNMIQQKSTVHQEKTDLIGVGNFIISFVCRKTHSMREIESLRCLLKINEKKKVCIVYYR